MQSGSRFRCAGCIGHGFKLGLEVGLMTVCTIVGNDTPCMGRCVFRLSCYAENDPVRRECENCIVG